jgi:hypothetical protein
MEYFRRQRLSQIYHLRVMVAATKGNDNLMREAFQHYSETLFPEIGDHREDFRKVASKEMAQWRDKVIVLDGATATIKKVADVADELAALTKRSFELRGGGKKRRPGIA